MSQLSSKPDRSNSDDDADSTESDQLSPPTKRHCQSSNSQICLPNQLSSALVDLIPDDVKENKEECKSCGKQEMLLRAFNCPSLHYFCLNCIFNWTKKHIQTKTPPACLVVDCDYLLKHEDLDDLPITIKDHQILLELIQINIDKNEKINNLRIKCDKCCLYIDQHDVFIHCNQCLGSSVTIPCEICFCPILMDDYEQHMLLCTNDDNTTVAQFLCKHLQNPNVDVKHIKLFISSWQRKHRRAIDVYEMIETLNHTNGFSKETCDVCKNSMQSDEFYFLNCYENHSLCVLCYKQRVQNQMNNNVVLTCHQCTYHLQDKDLSENRIFTNEEIVTFQNYQSKKVFELYSNLYGAEDMPDANVTSQSQPQPQQQVELTVMNDDSTPRRKCELCSKQHPYGNIFVLNCNCKICYNCFAIEVNRQRTITNELLICSLCRSPIKHNDLSNLRLPPGEIQAIQSYQQGKLFEAEHAVHFSRQKSSQITNNVYNHDDDDDDDVDVLLLNQQQYLPKYWALPMLTNFSRHTLDLQSTEYKFVADRFNHSWAKLKNQLPAPVPVAPLRVVRRPRVPRSALAPTLIGPPLPAQPPVPTLPQSSVFAPPTNNHVAAQLQAGLLQRIHSIQVPNTNSNNGSAINQQQQQQQNHGFGNLSYNLSLGTNSMATQSSTALPMHPSMPFLPQPMYGPNMLYTGAIGPPPMPQGNTQPVARLPAPPRPPVLTAARPEIIQIERIQNQRWFKQYSAHKCEFRQKLGKHTEQWLFHGCDERSSKNIEVEWFNRSYAGQHAVAFGQGCYFACDALYSHNYASPDRNGIRRMFLARVLLGNTTQGNSTMRVAPPGYDTTGDGQSIFVTYHDSQAYAEYLISYR